MDNNSTTQQRLLSSMVQFGLFFVQDIPSYNSSNELKTLKSFFELPLETKMALAVKKHRPESSNAYRGYGPLVGGLTTQFKEMYNIGPFNDIPQFKPSSTENSLELYRAVGRETNLWPKTDDPMFDTHFKNSFIKSFETRRSVGKAVVRCIGSVLGHPELSDRFIEHEFSTLGLRRYPAGTEDRLTELEHEDSTVTILSTFQVR